MTDNPEKPYRTGPGKPPRNRMWKKGQSGNPKGRPRKSRAETLHEALDYELDKFRKVKLGDDVEDITNRELIIKQVIALAAKGDKKAIDVIMKMDRQSYEAKVLKHRPGGVLLVGMAGEPTAAGKAKGLTLLQEIEEQQAPYRSKTVIPPPPGQPTPPPERK
jgi:hypothetical protein